MQPTRILMIAVTAVLAAACGGVAVPGGPTQRPGGATQAPGGSVVAPAGGTCSLVTADEMSAIFGAQMTISDTSNGSCTYTATTGLPSVDLRFETTDLGTAKTILGQSAADVSVAGNPGVIGNLLGLILYVSHGGQDLVVQAPLFNDTPDNRNALVAVATKALSRIP